MIHVRWSQEVISSVFILVIPDIANPNILSNLEVPVPAFCRLGTKNHEYKPYIWLGVGG